MNCKKCGYLNIKEGAMVCTKCGKRLRKKSELYDESAELLHKKDGDRANYYGREMRERKSGFGDFVPVLVLLFLILIVSSYLILKLI